MTNEHYLKHLIVCALYLLTYSNCICQRPDTLNSLELIIPGKYLKTTTTTRCKIKSYTIKEENLSLLDSFKLNTDTLKVVSYWCELKDYTQLKRFRNGLDHNLKDSIIQLSHRFFIYNVEAASESGRTYITNDEVLINTRKTYFGLNGGILMTLRSGILDGIMGTAYTRETNHLNYFADFTISRGHSVLGAGVVASPHLVKDDYYDVSKNYGASRINGFKFLYLYKFHPKAEIFSAFLKFQFIYFRHENSGKIMIWSQTPNPTLIEGDYRSIWMVRYAYLNCGLNFKLLGGIEAFSSAGFGLVANRENRNTTPRLVGSLNPSYTDVFTSLMVDVGLRYTIK